MRVQCPSAPGASQASQLASQAASQQTPSTQWAVGQASGATQASPIGAKMWVAVAERTKSQPDAQSSRPPNR